MISSDFASVWLSEYVRLAAGPETADVARGQNVRLASDDNRLTAPARKLGIEIWDLEMEPRI